MQTGEAQVATGRDTRGAGAATGQAGDVDRNRVLLQGMAFVDILDTNLYQKMFGLLRANILFKLLGKQEHAKGKEEKQLGQGP